MHKAFVHELKPNPIIKASIFSKLSYWYLKDLFKIGWVRKIVENDIYEVLEQHKSKNVSEKFEKYWSKEKRKPNPSLVRCVVSMYWFGVLGVGFLAALADPFLSIAQPLCLGNLVTYFLPGQTDISKTEAYMYAFGIILCSCIPVLVFHPFLFYMRQACMKIKLGCCSMIYRKCLKMSKSSVYDGMNGQVINLMTNDVSRFNILFFIHDLWKGPVETMVLGYLVYREIGISALFGIGFILLFVPCYVWAGKKQASYLSKTAERTDVRVRFMNEIIQGIQAIKMYAWEKSFIKIIDKIRYKELDAIQGAYNIRAFLLSLMVSSKCSTFLSLASYVYFGNTLTARKVFVSSTLFEILNMSMSTFWPEAISLFAESMVSLKRIQTFLLRIEEKEVKEFPIATGNKNWIKNEKWSETDEIQTLIFKRRKEDLDTEEKGLILENVTAVWNSNETQGIFSFTMNVKANQLCCVVGAVGGGKSTLLNVIIGELAADNGLIEVNGKISYAAQEPWLFEASIRQNIIFVEEFNEERYRNVCQVCCLDRDFELLPYGDSTIAGEKGVVLSGGQKARVSLARTIYKKADIYLLDDPLSAVDALVGKYIFNECILKFLCDKCVVLVTHQLQYLHNCDNIIIMEQGKIVQQGSYDKLKSSKIESVFSSFHEEASESPIHKRDEIIMIPKKTENKLDAPDVDEEEMKEGNVGFKVFKMYFKAVRHIWMVLFVILIFIFQNLVRGGVDYFVSFWVNWEEAIIERNTTVLLVSNNTDMSIETVPNHIFLRDDIHAERNMLMVSYTVLILIYIVLTAVSYFLFFRLAIKASGNLHNQMFQGITRASIQFFNVNQSGRILNRFSKDIGKIDDGVPNGIIDTSIFVFYMATIIGLVVVMNFWLIIPALLMIACFYLIQHVYLNTSRCVTRLEAKTQSPILSHTNATLQGLTTIRSQKAQAILQNEFDKIQDLNTSNSFLCYATATAFAFWLDVICVLYISVVVLSFLLLEDIGSTFLGGSVGLAITSALGLLGLCQWGMSRAAELELSMIAVERVQEFIELPTEAPLQTDVKPLTNWPTHGEIKFENLSFRYNPDGVFVLNNLNFTIKPKEKIGIVGRTGAGKSSLIQAIFRLAELNGKIIIDDIDISVLGLHDLRSKLAIIPQNPVLFSGTIRMNLDPFDDKTDADIYSALEKVELKEYITSLNEGLNYRISDEGSNFSTGQRQLICLARAILRNNNILILDEATANIDLETDNLIQKTIREKFSECTVLTIAHRLHTVIDSDRVLVIDAGHVVEFDHPHLLMKNKSGSFKKLVNQTGSITSNILLHIAEQNYAKKKLN